MSAAARGADAVAEADNANQEATAAIAATQAKAAAVAAGKLATTNKLRVKEALRATAEGESSGGAATIMRRAQATALPQDLDD